MQDEEAVQRRVICAHACEQAICRHGDTLNLGHFRREVLAEINLANFFQGFIVGSAVLN